MSHKAINIMLIAVSIFALIGSIVTAYLLAQSEDSEIITLKIEDGTHETVGFESLCMLPGEESVYEFALAPTVAGGYTISLDFSETKAGALAQYAYARIELGGETVEEKRLDALLDGDAILLSRSLSEYAPLLLTLTYYIPEQVGNEAQAASIGFVLDITVNSEETSNE